MRRLGALLLATALAIAFGTAAGLGHWSRSAVYLAAVVVTAVFVAFTAPLVLLRPLGPSTGTSPRSTRGGLPPARRRRPTAGESKIVFKDVAGVDEAVEQLGEVRDYLGNPDGFRFMGVTPPKGILLTGPTGTGKTLLARALAGEAEVPFLSVSGSDFVETFAGEGPARIRAVFAAAKASAPCVVLIDMLDAVGRARTGTSAGAQDGREAVLNQLLVEMDGLESGSGVVVLAATDRPDVLDSALLRSERFDRRVAIDRPDVTGREAILKIHARGKPLAADVDLRTMATRTAGFTGADLANVVNQAAMGAARRGAQQVESRDLFEAVERLVARPDREAPSPLRTATAWRTTRRATQSPPRLSPALARLASSRSWLRATPAASAG